MAMAGDDRLVAVRRMILHGSPRVQSACAARRRSGIGPTAAARVENSDAGLSASDKRNAHRRWLSDAARPVFARNQFLKHRGHQVTATDLNFQSHRVPGRYLNDDPEIVSRSLVFGPDALGISTTTSERHNARFWGRLTKGYLADLKVVIGGSA
jgi:hypothetical protein